MHNAASVPVHLSVIAPALNEGPCLRELATRLHAALGGQSYELLIIDDASTDNTAIVLEQLQNEGLPVRHIRRDHATDGLSGAVLHGFAHAHGQVLVVMDADLQHPPEIVPELVAVIDNTAGVDMAIGTRYGRGGSTAKDWSSLRLGMSHAATRLAAPFSRSVSDPMTGLFAIRADVVRRAGGLVPMGYKIALELLSKCPIREVAEVPFRFEARHAGHSKFTAREQLRYLEHLSRLYDWRFPRASPIAKFAIVTAAAWLAGGVVAFAVITLHVADWAAVSIGYLAAISVIAAVHARYLKHHSPLLNRLGRSWPTFAAASAVEWLACLAVAGHLDIRTNASAVDVLLFGFAAATLLRYVLRKELGLDDRGIELAEQAAQETRGDA